jgi:hypothetical protein
VRLPFFSLAFILKIYNTLIDDKNFAIIIFMKAYKLILIFAVVIFAMVGILWALGLIGSEQALDISGKAIAVVLILGISSVIVLKLLSVPNSDKDISKSNQQGPKF